MPGEFTFIPGWLPQFQYDPANPQTIDRDNTITISVIEGNPPYTWSVSGTGFDLEESQTTELSNILLADDTACGSADITVTDASGSTVKGSVRCTVGAWVKQDITGMTAEEACPIPGPATEEPWYNGRTRIEGKYKVNIVLIGYGRCDEWGHPERDCRCEVRGCDSSCKTYDGTSGKCHPVMGCSKCVGEGDWINNWTCQAEGDETESASGTIPPCCEYYRIPSATRYMECYCNSGFELHIWECN